MRYFSHFSHFGIMGIGKGEGLALIHRREVYVNARVIHNAHFASVSNLNRNIRKTSFWHLSLCIEVQVPGAFMHSTKLKGED